MTQTKPKRFARPDRVVVAPDSFKGTLSAREASDAIAAGVHHALPGVEVDACPLSDGGEGFLDVLAPAIGAARREAEVCGPLGTICKACWAQSEVDPRIGYVELAQAAGLMLVPPDQRDPERTTTFGVGQLIAAAMEAGCETVIVGLGGSATCDGGAGMLQAMNAAFFDAAGRQIHTPIRGSDLARIARVDPPLRLPRLLAACDVLNPLFGPRGAAAVFAPQKGAAPAQVARLDAALRHFASITGGDPDQPHAGAAGGCAFGLATLCGAALRSGIDLVLDLLRFDRRLSNADLVITGEGRFDASSRQGKVVSGVARHAVAANLPVIALVGACAPETADLAASLGLSGVWSISNHPAHPRTSANASAALQALTEAVLEREIA